MDSTTLNRSGNLLRIADRLAVQRSLENTFKHDRDSQQAVRYEFSKDVIFSKLLEPKEPPEPIKVNQGPPGKVRRREYTWRRKTTEGASLVCEICGHLAYKLFTQVVESFDGKRNRRQFNDSVQVCRPCFIEQNGGRSYSTSSGEVKKIKPNFEHTLFGNTSIRASNAWHFVRKDFITTKVKRLLNHECNENEYSDKFISDDSLSDVTSDENDTSYEDSENEYERYKLPFQFVDNSSPVSPFESTFISNRSSMLDSDDANLETDQSNGEIELLLKAKKFSIILDDINSSKNDLNVNIINRNLKASSTDEGSSSDNSFRDSRKVNTQESTPVRDECSLCTKDFSSTFLRNLLEVGDIEILRETKMSTSQGKLFEPCYKEGNLSLYDFDDKYTNVKIVKQDKKARQKCKTRSKPSIYKGVCGLVTILNGRGRRLLDGSGDTNLYDEIGFCLRKKDLPSYVGINTSKYSVGKGRVQTRKDNVDRFLMPRQRNSKLRGRITKDDLSSIREQQRFQESANFGKRRCAKCKQVILGKYVTFDREQAPLYLFKYFKDNVEIISVCSGCHSDTTLRKDDLNKDMSPTMSNFEVNIATEFGKHHSSKLTLRENGRSRQIGMKYKKKRKPWYRKKQRKTMIDSSCLNSETNSPDQSDNSESDTESAVEVVTKPENLPTMPLRPPIKRMPIPKVNVDIIRNRTRKELTLKKILPKNNLKYYIVQTQSSSNVIKKPLLGAANNEAEASNNCQDILINGQRFRIDKEIKLNELVKENENALRSMDIQKDLLNQLPNILQKTIGSKPGGNPTQFKIVNVIQANAVGNISKLPGLNNKTNLIPVSVKPISINKSVSGQKIKDFIVTNPVNLTKPHNVLTPTSLNPPILIPKSVPLTSSNITIKPAGDICLTQANLLQAENKARKESLTDKNILVKSALVNSAGSKPLSLKTTPVIPIKTEIKSESGELCQSNVQGTANTVNQTTPRTVMQTYKILENKIFPTGAL